MAGRTSAAVARPHTAPRPPSARVLRRHLEETLDRLLDAVEGVVARLDALDPDADLEPTLGAPERHSRFSDHWRGPRAVTWASASR
jgi:hypothetical protein